MTRYLKLGPKASSFYDPVTKITLTSGKVIEKPKKKSYFIKKALEGGHIKIASREEFIASTKGIEVKTSKTQPEDELLEKSAEEILAEYQWLDEEDLTKAQSFGDNVPALVEYIRKIEKEYN